MDKQDDEISIIIYPLEQKCVTRLKMLVKTNSALSKWKKLTSASINRYNRLKQLTITEEEYYQDLKTLQQKIKIPLIQFKIISNLKAEQMFTDIESMMLLSLDIKKGLAQRLQNWNSMTTMIGDYMAGCSKFLLVYSGYFKNLSETQAKMKELSQMNPQIRQLQKALSTKEKIVTIQDLIIKPLQRPLKYSLILKDYVAKLEQTHPDYKRVKNAITEFHKVNEQNNLQMDHKIKDNILIELDKKYGSIIQVQARYYVRQFNALLIDNTHIIIYILTDVIIVVDQTTDKENMRLILNKYSLVVLPKNEKKIINGLYLYGQSRCIYLRFQNEDARKQVLKCLKSQLINMSKNEFLRQKILTQRINRGTIEQTSPAYASQDKQLTRPLIAKVVGFEKRGVSQQKVEANYVLQFKASPRDQDQSCLPQQLSFLSWQKLLQLQSFIVQMYPNSVRFFPLNTLPKYFRIQMLQKDQNLNFQIKSIYITLFLNSIFRSQTILKRVDIICKNLNICDAIWKHLGSAFSKICFCNNCIAERQYQSYDQYQKQVNKRLKNTTGSNNNSEKRFCEIRTINSQTFLSRIPSHALKQAGYLQRIAWVKAKRGFVNHTLTNISPPVQKLLTIKVWLYNINGRDYVNMKISPNCRIKQLIDELGRQILLDLSDYGLQILMGENTYLLSEDEILGNVYNQYHQHSGIISKFFALFTADNYFQTFYLKKIWTLEPVLENICDTQRLIMRVEQAICRIKRYQIRVSDEDIYQIYAYFFSYIHYAQLDILKLAHFQLYKEELYYILPQRFKEKKNLPIIFEKIKHIQENKRLKRDHLLKNILSTVQSKPGWSCMLFKAKEQTSLDYDIIYVRIGCDIHGLKIRDEKSCEAKYQFRFEDNAWQYKIVGEELIIRCSQRQDNAWQYKIVGEELIIRCSQRQYVFTGRDMWKLNQQIQFYEIYYKTFIKNALPRGAIQLESQG